MPGFGSTVEACLHSRSRRPRKSAAAHARVLHAVWAAMQQLPERQRTAITLRFYLDLPDDQIADLIGARPGTVRSLVHRALATLKEAVPHE